MKFKLLFLSLCAALALTACDKKDAAPAADAAKPVETAKPAEAAKPADAAKPAEATTPAADPAKPADPAPAAKPAEKVTASSIPECEDFLKKYETCINDKVPAAQRDAVKQGLDQMRTSFDQALAQGADKAAMAEGCKQATQQVKPMLEPLGCSF